MQHRDSKIPTTFIWRVIVFHNLFSFLIIWGEEKAKEAEEESLGDEKILKYLFLYIHH